MTDKEQTFLTLLNDYKGILYRVANTYCKEAVDREDLLQEIILQVWRSLDNYNDQYRWSTWIYRVALNTAISFYRSNKNRKEKTVSLSPIIEVPVVEEEGLEDADFLLLRRLVRELKEIDRALMLLHFDGLTSREIAEVLNTSQTNVTTKISRIKKKLTTQFIEAKNKENGQ